MLQNHDVASELSFDELRERGNECTKNEKFEEALKLYSEAITISETDARLYSNRSFVYLRLKRYYDANRDADMAIQLNQNWAKAHFRKAEIYFAIGYYDTALLSYGRALAMNPDDNFLIKAAQKAATYSNQQNEYELRLPWVGAGIGIILSVIISVIDQFMTTEPSIQNPALMVIFVVLFACFGYLIARTIRYYQRLHKKSLLDPQYNEIEDKCKTTQNSAHSENISEQMVPNRNRYTKAQARMKLKKGKS